jgi:hypothetical protein
VRRKFHARFCNGAGVGDHSSDRNGGGRATALPTATVRRHREVNSFMLRPDRLSLDGRPYNPYKVEVIFLGCKIKSLTVIEFISWE